MPKIIVRIEVRPAERFAGGWSVAYGGDRFTYCQNYSCDSFDSLGEYLESLAGRLAFDPRVSRWPGLQVEAIRTTPRKPNGWDANRSKTVARVQIVCLPD